MREDLADLEAKVKAYQVSTFKGFENDRFQKHDELITELVRNFNNDIKTKADKGDKRAQSIMRNGGYLNADLLKSLMLQEAGGTFKQWDVDPMTVNHPGDWKGEHHKEKEAVGLKKSDKFPSGDIESNVRAGILFLANKGFITKMDPKTQKFVTEFKGWKTAFNRYGPGNPDYYDKINRRGKNK